MSTHADINECLESAMRGMDLCQPPMFCQDVSGDNGKFNCLCPDGTILDGNMCGTCVWCGYVCSTVCVWVCEDCCYTIIRHINFN